LADNTSNPILWGEATKVGDQLFWCEGKVTVAVPVAVSGNTSEPFFLVSFPQATPNLNALPVSSDVKVDTVFCMHSPEIKKMCDFGNRTNELSPLDKFANKYKLSFKKLKGYQFDYYGRSNVIF